MQTAETHVRSTLMFVAMCDQSTQVFYVDVVMLLSVALIVQDQQRDCVQPFIYVRAEVENRKLVVFRIDSHAVNGDIRILTFEARNVFDKQRKGQSIEVQLARVARVILNAIVVISSRMQMS